jgi:hypothetical protein
LCTYPWIMFTAEGIALILGAVATLVTSVATAVVMIMRREVKQIQAGVQDVHTLVNQNRSDMLAYQNDLVQVLVEHGLMVPRDKSTK